MRKIAEWIPEVILLIDLFCFKFKLYSLLLPLKNFKFNNS